MLGKIVANALLLVSVCSAASCANPSNDGACPGDSSDTSALLQGRISAHKAGDSGQPRETVMKVSKQHFKKEIKHIRVPSMVEHRAQMKDKQLQDLANAQQQTHRRSKLLSDDALAEVEAILGEVNTTDSNAALNAMNNDEKHGKDAGAEVVGASHYHHTAMEAIEEVSVSVEVADQLNQTGSIVTGDLLQQLDNLTMTPEGMAAQNGSDVDVAEGDMATGGNETQHLLLLELSRQGKRNVMNKWEDNMHIKYCFSSGAPASVKKAVHDAVQHYKDHVPCLDFEEVAVGSETNKKCSQEPAIFVYASDSGCFANVGQPWFWNDEWGGSVMHLQPNGCDTMGIAAHELGHNLGMLHEQSRKDHDKYVKILWDNIQGSMKSQYAESDADTSVPYDAMSLMHYSDTAFGVGGGKKTMVFTGDSKVIMGNRMGLTHADAKQVAQAYGCLDQLTHFKLCTEKSDSCTTESCKCLGTDVIKIKTTNAHGAECYRCASQCPAAPYGTSGSCGCPEGCTKDCFTSGGTEYCSCNADCTPMPAPTPAPNPAPTSAPGGSQTEAASTQAPTPVPTATSAPTTVAPSPAGACQDMFSFCWMYADWCSPYMTIGDGTSPDQPIEKGCAVTCGTCDKLWGDSCVDHATWKDPIYNEECGGWEGYDCAGVEYWSSQARYKDLAKALVEKCPKACRECYP